MAFVKVGTIAQVPPGSVMEARVGQEAYAICNVDGELHALEGFCPHAGGPLGHGALHGFTLVCPWHAWEFDCRTGANDFDPDIVVPSFPVKVEDGEILIDLNVIDV
jgi:nitrite reductase (NADH) small subunit